MLILIRRLCAATLAITLWLSGNAAASNCLSENQFQQWQAELMQQTRTGAALRALQQGDLSQPFSLGSILGVDLSKPLPDPGTLQNHWSQQNQRYLMPVECDLSGDELALQNKLLDMIQTNHQRQQSYLQLESHRLEQLDLLIRIGQQYRRLSLALSEQITQKNLQLKQLESQITEQEQLWQTTTDTNKRTLLATLLSDLETKAAALREDLVELHNTQQYFASQQKLSEHLILDFNRAFVEKSKAGYFALPYLARLNLFEGLEQEKPYKTASLATLILIANDIYNTYRLQNSVWPLLRRDLPLALSLLHWELRALLFVPPARYQLQLENLPSDDSLIKNPYHLNQRSLALHLIVQLILFFGLLKILPSLPVWIAQQQRKLLLSRSQSPTIRWSAQTLRLLQPHASWSTALVLHYLGSRYAPNWLDSPRLMIDALLALSFFYLFKMVALWSLGETHTQAYYFIAEKRQQQIRHASRLFAIQAMCVLISYQVIHSVLAGGLILDISGLLVAVAIWLFLLRLIQPFSEAVWTHLGKVVAPNKFTRISTYKDHWLRFFLLPPIFFTVHILDLLYGINRYLMHFERYQKITAKLIKIRLEQSQDRDENQEAPQPEEGDHQYEYWFLKASPGDHNRSLIIRPDLLDELSQSVDNWASKKQEENNLLLVGDSGIGKSTLIDQWIAEWKTTPCQLVRVPSKVTTQADLFRLLSEALTTEPFDNVSQFVNFNKHREPTVIIIEQADNLFLADVGGFEAYKALQALVNTSLQNLYWIIVLNKQSWIYLNDVFGHAHPFNNLLHYQRWSQQELRRLILNRHRASRRRLIYDDLLLSSAYHSETATRGAEFRCFSLLWDLSAGIPSVAMAIWVNSARKAANGVIEIGVPERPSKPILNELSDDFLFVFSAIIIHDNLTAEQAQAVTHLPEPIIRRAFKLGLDHGLLMRHDHQNARGIYTVAPLWYLQLCSVLKRKNFLHE